MEKDTHQEKRAANRSLLDQYYSVEFLLKETGNVYQFKLRDMSSQGLGILVREDSAVLQYLKVGNTLAIQYRSPDAMGPAETFKTRIRHITKMEPGFFARHFSVGLEILEKQPADE